MTSKINKYTIDLKGNISLIQNKTKDYKCRSQSRQNLKITTVGHKGDKTQ